MLLADLDQVDGPRESSLVRVRRVAADDEHTPRGIEPALDLVVHVLAAHDPVSPVEIGIGEAGRTYSSPLTTSGDITNLVAAGLFWGVSRPLTQLSRLWTLVAIGRKGAPVVEDELFERGLQVRREVLGAEYVDASLEAAGPFTMAFQRLLTEWAWGLAWSRPGLDRKTRSLLKLAILTALGRPDELAVYVRGALATGCTVQEIQEVLLHATVYCGTPAGRQAFLAADAALKAAGAVE